ncbi:MAG: polyprenyl diphosphate synthase [Candidatus Woesebacteria bacterium]|jgi:undecaprenyl diphosphate synthase
MKKNPLKHLAIIMDGNRRWARKKGLAIFKGHQLVANEKIESLVEACIEYQIPYITFWAFSTENWKRDQKEINYLMQLFRDSFSKSSQKLHEKGVRIKTIGDLSRFDEDIQRQTKDWIEKTKDNNKITVTFALNYGGRDEIVRAVAALLQDLQSGKLKLKPSQVAYSKKKRLITEKLFAKYLDTADLPDPDLIIRTGGEQRMSGFLTWSGIYAEYYFTEVLMPDFDKDELDKALAEFAKRQRRFGG